MRYNQHAKNCTYLICNLMNLEMNIQPWNHHTICGINHIHHLQKFLKPSLLFFPPSFLRHAWWFLDFLFFSMSAVKALCFPLYTAAATSHNAKMSLSFSLKYSLISIIMWFYGYFLTHCLYRSILLNTITFGDYLVILLL